MRYEVRVVTKTIKSAHLNTDNLQDAADMASIIIYCGGIAEVVDLDRGHTIPLGVAK